MKFGRISLLDKVVIPWPKVQLACAYLVEIHNPYISVPHPISPGTGLGWCKTKQDGYYIVWDNSFTKDDIYIQDQNEHGHQHSPPIQVAGYNKNGNYMELAPDSSRDSLQDPPQVKVKRQKVKETITTDTAVENNLNEELNALRIQHTLLEKKYSDMLSLHTTALNNLSMANIAVRHL